MAKRGRPPKSRAERLANGNAGKRKLPPPAPDPASAPGPAAATAALEADPLDAPPYLGATAQAAWRVAAAHLAKRGLLRPAYLPSLVAYCQAWETIVECGTALQTGGRTYATPTGQIKRRPEFDMMATAWTTVRQLAAEFGLTSLQAPRLDAALAAVGRQPSLPGLDPAPGAAPAAAEPAPPPRADDPVARFLLN